MAYSAAQRVLSGYRGGPGGYNPYSMYGRDGGRSIPVTPTQPTVPTVAGTTGYEWDMPWDPATSGYSWWPKNVQNIGDVWRSSGDPAAGNVKQNWYRSPDWPMGGDIEGAIYNPYWGWQDMADVKNLYRQAQGPVTWDQFQKWGLQKTGVGQDWQDYFEEYGGEGGGDGGGGEGGGTEEGGDQNYQSYLDWLDTLSATPQTYGDTTNPEDMLGRFGYTGEIPINEYENLYLNAMKQLYTQEPTALNTIQPANQFYQDVLGGSVAPTGQPFRSAVYNATKAGAMQNYNDMRRNLATRFSERGGYFGGGHSIAQAKLAGETSNSLNQILAGLNLEGFNQDVTARQAAASGLAGLGTTQQGISSQILSDILGGGNLITQRDLTNRAEKQQAQGLAYQDWLRARNESMQPFNAAASLLGYQAFQPMAQQPQESQWGKVLAALLQAGGTVGAAAISSKKWKKDIVTLSKEEEKKIFENLQKVPLFKYRYTHEPDSVPLHVGLIAEEAPEEIRLFDGQMIGLYEYIAYINAAFKILVEKVKALEAGR